MSDFKTLVRLLCAIAASEDLPHFSVACVDEKVLKADAKTRDRLALKLQKEGYIEGLFIIDGVDNAESDVILWNQSRPKVTIKGMEYMEENKSFRKVGEEIKKEIINMAASFFSAWFSNHF